MAKTRNDPLNGSVEDDKKEKTKLWKRLHYYASTRKKIKAA